MNIKKQIEKIYKRRTKAHEALLKCDMDLDKVLRKKVRWLSGCCNAPVIDDICQKCKKKVKGAYQSNYKRNDK